MSTEKAPLLRGTLVAAHYVTDRLGIRSPTPNRVEPVNINSVPYRQKSRPALARLVPQPVDIKQYVSRRRNAHQRLAYARCRASQRPNTPRAPRLADYCFLALLNDELLAQLQPALPPSHPGLVLFFSRVYLLYGSRALRVLRLPAPCWRNTLIPSTRGGRRSANTRR